MRQYLNEADDPATEALKGAFQFVVDTGCTTTTSPHKEDFESLVKLATANQDVTCGGTIKFNCISSPGDVVTIRTFGYYNPHQNIRLFSPQAFFYHLPTQQGAFTISWSKYFLHLQGDIIPCQICKHTFLPMLMRFHDVKWSVANLAVSASPVTTSNLTSFQQQLLRFHEKLGHIGFTHLKYLLSRNLMGPLGIRCSKSDVLPPQCHACLIGGQQRRPIAGNKHTQDPTRKGILKAEQLIPGQRVFSDQYVSSVEGKNFSGRGHSQSALGYKGAFVDAKSTFISLHHQVGFTAAETIGSKLAF